MTYESPAIEKLGIDSQSEMSAPNAVIALVAVTVVATGTWVYALSKLPRRTRSEKLDIGPLAGNDRVGEPLRIVTLPGHRRAA